MAAEDEAMVVREVTVHSPDDEGYLRLELWAEKGNLSVPQASQEIVKTEAGVDEDGDVDGKVVMVGAEAALNEALTGLIYSPPQDWTSFQQARVFVEREKCHIVHRTILPRTCYITHEV